MIRVIIIGILLLSLVGCRKSTGPVSANYPEVLEGRWEWLGSFKIAKSGGGYEYLTPESEGVTYAIEFNYGAGEITYYKDNKKLKVYGMELVYEFVDWDQQGNVLDYDIEFYLNGKKRNQLSIFASASLNDISNIRFPFGRSDEEYRFSNHFYRTN